MRRVLIVEDDVQVQNLLVEICHLCGVSTVTASNGKEGLALAQKETFDLIFTDFNMPVMSGEEMIKQLLSLKSLPKIYLMSGTRKESEIDRSVAQVAQFLTKPFDLSVIKKILSN